MTISKFDESGVSTKKIYRPVDITMIKEVTVVEILLVSATFRHSQMLKLSLDDLINSGCRKIIVDLRNCESIDSTFWGVVIYAQKKIHRLDGSIRIMFQSKKQSALCIATGIDKIFKMYDNLSNAVNSFTDNPLGQTIMEYASDFN